MNVPLYSKTESDLYEEKDGLEKTIIRFLGVSAFWSVA